MTIKWEDGFEINVRINKGTVCLSANRQGLLSLARHLTMLADETVGSHVHYDEYNALETGSAELIIEKAK